MTTEQPGARSVTPLYNGVAAWDAIADPRQVLRNLKQSELLLVIEDYPGDWLKVRLPEGVDGFVRRNTIREVVASPAAPEPAIAPTLPVAPTAEPVAQAAAFPRQPPRAAAAVSSVAHPPTTSPRGFLSRVFDMSLTSFITPSIIRFIFIAWVVVSTLALAIVVVVGFAANPGVGIVLLILSPFIFLLNVIIIRIYMELLIVIFRIEENTRR